MIKCVFEKEITDVETNIIYGDSVGDETWTRKRSQSQTSFSWVRHFFSDHYSGEESPYKVEPIPFLLIFCFVWTRVPTYQMSMQLATTISYKTTYNFSFYLILSMKSSTIVTN
jgi:hypothetical protein